MRLFRKKQTKLEQEVIQIIEIAVPFLSWLKTKPQSELLLGVGIGDYHALRCLNEIVEELKLLQKKVNIELDDVSTEDAKLIHEHISTITELINILLNMREEVVKRINHLKKSSAENYNKQVRQITMLGTPESLAEKTKRDKALEKLKVKQDQTQSQISDWGKFWSEQVELLVNKHDLVRNQINNHKKTHWQTVREVA